MGYVRILHISNYTPSHLDSELQACGISSTYRRTSQPPNLSGHLSYGLPPPSGTM